MCCQKFRFHLFKESEECSWSVSVKSAIDFLSWANCRTFFVEMFSHSTPFLRRHFSFWKYNLNIEKKNCASLDIFLYLHHFPGNLFKEVFSLAGQKHLQSSKNTARQSGAWNSQEKLFILSSTWSSSQSFDVQCVSKKKFLSEKELTSRNVVAALPQFFPPWCECEGWPHKQIV